MSGRALQLAAALALTACTQPPRGPAPAPVPGIPQVGLGAAPAVEPPGAIPVAAAAPAPTLRRASGRVEVKLTALCGRTTLSVHDPIAGEVTLQRRGERVRAGSVEREEWLLAPAAGASGLRVEQSLVPGLLRVRPDRAGGLDVLAVVDLEDYVAGVLAGELAVWSAPAALLEAQAIASRSYAVAELDHRARSSRSPYLYDDTRDQAWRPPPARGAPGDASVRAAVERTRGLVLVEGRRVVDARFHAACGGRTADAREVFPESDATSLRPVPCAPCLERPGPEWSTTATRAELDALSLAVGAGQPLRALRPEAVDEGGRWLRVTIDGPRASATVPFQSMRLALGAQRVASALVLGTWPQPGMPIQGGLLLRGRGSGHGVGLCQRGARGYAQRGWSAERILAHYYPGARVEDRR